MLWTIIVILVVLWLLGFTIGFAPRRQLLLRSTGLCQSSAHLVLVSWTRGDG
jgi:hypothetical protein